MTHRNQIQCPSKIWNLTALKPMINLKIRGRKRMLKQKMKRTTNHFTCQVTLWISNFIYMLKILNQVLGASNWEHIF